MKMTKIIINGINGKMGQVILSCSSQRNDCTVVGGIDISESKYAPVPVFKNAMDINIDCDVIIDFSHPDSLESLLTYAEINKKPVVICTTGLSQEQIEKIKQKSKTVPIFFSGNMSLGINLLIELSKKAQKVFSTNFDVEIVEKHHNQKIDAPSGTALMIADAIASVRDDDPKYIYDRHSYRRSRNKNEIGIHSVRGGTIVGEHEVIFAGHDEVFSISHTAQSKEIFATGSINAAVFLSNMPAGLYDMSDMLNSKPEEI